MDRPPLSSPESLVLFTCGAVTTLIATAVQAPVAWCSLGWVLSGLAWNTAWSLGKRQTVGVILAVQLMVPPWLARSWETPVPVSTWLAGWITATACLLFAAGTSRWTRRIAAAASRDELTGLLTRAAFRERLDKQLQHSRSTGTGFCLAFLDCDQFKQYNDQMGHPQGDQLLRVVGQTLQAQVRASDAVGRYGGDEFTVLLEGVSESEGVQVIQRLQAAVLEATEAAGHRISVSSGTIELAEFDLTADEIIRRADQRMYAAKKELAEL